MSDQQTTPEKIRLSVSVSILGIVVLIIVFGGTPDLMDAIMYRLTDGQTALPTESVRP